MITQDLNVIEHIIYRSSKYLRVVRIIAWILRFYKNIKQQIKK